VYYPAAPPRETHLIRKSSRVRTVRGCVLVSHKKLTRGASRKLRELAGPLATEVFRVIKHP